MDAQASFFGTIDSSTRDFQIGGFAGPDLSVGYGAFTGSIDEPQIFNRALTANEVAAIYAAGSSGQCKVPTGIPHLTSVTPNADQQGKQNLAVTISGQFTNFSQATSQVSFGAGITVSSVTVASPTSLTAQISILNTAATGLRTVTVTTGSEALSLFNGFSVNPPNRAPLGVDDTYAVMARDTQIVAKPGFQARSLYRGLPLGRVSALSADNNGHLFIGDYGSIQQADARLFQLTLASKTITTIGLLAVLCE